MATEVRGQLHERGRRTQTAPQAVQSNDPSAFVSHAICSGPTLTGPIQNVNDPESTPGQSRAGPGYPRRMLVVDWMPTRAVRTLLPEKWPPVGGVFGQRRTDGVRLYVVVRVDDNGDGSTTITWEPASN